MTTETTTTTILVTGSGGHLGQALMRTLETMENYEGIGVDVRSTPYTHHVGSVADRDFVHSLFTSHPTIRAVFHTASLHKPHVMTHTRQDFVDTNITGTLNLLEESVLANVQEFLFVSTTSLFGDAMKPQLNGPAVRITEEVVPLPKNIYGVSKVAAEQLCQLFYRLYQLPCVVLRTSRFFMEEDDQQHLRETFVDDTNVKAIEFLNRRVDIADIVDAVFLAMEKAQEIGFDKFIITATTPFVAESDLQELNSNGPAVVERYFPNYKAIYERRGWSMLEKFDRVYMNDHAREKLGWKPKYDFQHWLDCLDQGTNPWSPLATTIGCLGYHAGQTFDNEPYPALQEN